MPFINWIDCIIVLVVAAAAWEGVRLGLFRQLFAVVGFFGGLFLAGWLFPRILPIHDMTLLTLINGTLVLLAALGTATLGVKVGDDMRPALPAKTRRRTESYLGGLAGGLAMLALVWLLTAAIGRLPFVGLSNSVNDALIVQNLNHHLPPVPRVFAAFDQAIDPNKTPIISASSTELSTAPQLTQSLEMASAKARASTVRITSFSCGGLVTGSGFVVAPNVVMTNAHVIAGVKRPIVKYGDQSYEAKPILFNASTDVALLRTDYLSAKPLQLASHDVLNGTKVSTLGFPDGSFVISPGVIRDKQERTDSNIYGIGSVNRSMYGLQTSVSDGSSGGPIVLSNGQVVGMIFAQSTTSAHYGYALASSSLLSVVARAQSLQSRVGTGACVVG